MPFENGPHLLDFFLVITLYFFHVVIMILGRDVDFFGSLHLYA